MQVAVEQRNGGYYVTGTRVGLGSILHQHFQGAAVEDIAQMFPYLTPEQVRNAIEFYRTNHQAVEQYLAEQKRLWADFDRNGRPLSEDLRTRVQEAQQGSVVRSA